MTSDYNKPVYVLGTPQSGGCWLSNQDCFTSFEDADAVRKSKYRGLDNVKIFTLYPIKSETIAASVADWDVRFAKKEEAK